MSDWLRKKGEDIQNSNEEADRIRGFIDRSDFWLKIRQEIGADVEFLNKHSIWKDKLAHTPVEIVDSNGSFEIRQIIFPAVYVTVTNKYDVIELKIRGTKDKDSSSRSKPTENWQVASDGVEIYLKRDTEALRVPKQVSEYVLTLLTDQIDTTPTTFIR